MYEFEFEIFYYSLNLYHLNVANWLKVADTIDASLLLASLR
jgi:hypothetical protein